MCAGWLKVSAHLHCMCVCNSGRCSEVLLFAFRPSGGWQLLISSRCLCLTQPMHRYVSTCVFLFTSNSAMHPLYCHTHTATPTLPCPHCHTHTATPTLPHPHCHTHTATLTLPHPHCHTHTATPTLPHPRCHAHTATPTLWQCTYTCVYSVLVSTYM